MAELADAYGSGPYERKLMQVQVLLSAPFDCDGKWIVNNVQCRVMLIGICTECYSLSIFIMMRLEDSIEDVVRRKNDLQ